MFPRKLPSFLPSFLPLFLSRSFISKIERNRNEQVFLTEFFFSLQFRLELARSRLSTFEFDSRYRSSNNVALNINMYLIVVFRYIASWKENLKLIFLVFEGRYLRIRFD